MRMLWLKIKGHSTVMPSFLCVTVPKDLFLLIVLGDDCVSTLFFGSGIDFSDASGYGKKPVKSLLL